MTTHWQLNHSANFALIVCHSGLEINDSECSLFSTMQSITVLVLLLMWCTQTVDTQQGQWTVLVATFYISGLLPQTQCTELPLRAHSQAFFQGFNLQGIEWSSTQWTKGRRKAFHGCSEPVCFLKSYVTGVRVNLVSQWILYPTYIVNNVPPREYCTP